MRPKLAREYDGGRAHHATAVAVLRDQRRGVAIHRAHEAGIPEKIAEHERQAEKDEEARFTDLAADERRCADNLRAALPQVRQYRERAEDRLRVIARHFRHDRRARPSATPCLRAPVRKPRQRRSHRAVAKTAGGDSGDPDPEASRRTAAIGGVP